MDVQKIHYLMAFDTNRSTTEGVGFFSNAGICTIVLLCNLLIKKIK